MGIEIVKSGILDTIQDLGRFELAHLGITSSGVMDWFHAELANTLVQNPSNEAVIEMNFPAPIIRFLSPVKFGLAGADFGATLNTRPLHSNSVTQAQKNDLLTFSKKKVGERLYLAVAGGFHLQKVLGSYSTYLKAQFGGLYGKKLKGGDCLPINCTHLIGARNVNHQYLYPYQNTQEIIRLLPAPETALFLKLLGQAKFQFTISPHSDRMALVTEAQMDNLPISMPQMVSSAVQMGTVQFLPSGKMLIMMADYQTVGGYPRIGQVIAADLPKLAQSSANTCWTATWVSLPEAIEAYQTMNRYLQKTQNHLNTKI